MVGLVTRDAPLFFLGLTLLLAAGISYLWGRYCLRGIEYRRHLSQARVAWGETIDLEIEIVNRKLLPLSWLEIEEELPGELAPSRGQVYRIHKAGRSILYNLIALRPYERVRRVYPIPCLARGEHHLGPVRLRSGDLFGLVSREHDLSLDDAVVVYPRVVPLGELGLPAQHPLGDRRTRSWIFEDPTRIAGTRDYQPRDGLRWIHWAATARTQSLQTKVFEPSTEQNLVICLNCSSTPAESWGFYYDPDALELAITTAASLAAWAIDERYPVGLLTNGMHHGKSARIEVEASRDLGQLPRILEALGRLQPFAVRGFHQMIAEPGARLPYGATIVAVSPVITPEIADALLAVRRRGHAMTLILTGRSTSLPHLDGVAVRRVGPPEVWRDMTKIVRNEAVATGGPT